MNERSFKAVRHKTIVITGASSGIGEAVAREAGRRGARVVMLARRTEKLAGIAREIELDGGTAVVLGVDLTDPAARDRCISHIRARFPTIDVLISNAGGGWYGRMWEMNWESAENLIELNAVAAVRFVHALLPQMIARRSGHMVVIGSIAGSIPAQGIAVYSATKAFLDAFCRSLYRETRRSGVAVSIVKPGAVKTPFFDSAERRGGRRTPFSQAGVSAHRVARRVISVLRWRRRSVYVPFYLAIVPVVSFLFGGLMDLLGPIALKKQRKARTDGGGPDLDASRIVPRPQST